jgi:ubiquitin-like protein Pup
MAQEQKQPRKSEADEQAVETAPETDVADILDEIDDVLETNAEDFVKSFIQKGGQ